MPKNAYIHIPFCKSKCNYCSFTSFETTDLIKDYLLALTKEIQHYYNGEKLNTLYLGGGTPSLMNAEQVKSIVDMFDFEDDAEITIETNPNDVTENFLKRIFSAGVNRLSMGVQTFDDDILKIIGRRHTSWEALNALDIAKNVGFKNVSIDFIYGLPNQTMDKFKSDIGKAVTLPIKHISFYGLKIDEGCKFALNMPKNLPDSDMQADMYEFLCEFLPKNDFEHYEISNFSQKGFNSRHNLNYWNNNSYYGFGVSAHGFDGEKRYSNKCNLKEYLKNSIEHESAVVLSKQEKLEEEIFLGFRKASGINVERIKQLYGFDFEKEFKNILEKYKEYFIKTERGYAFDTKGFLISDLILSEFMFD